MGTQKKKEDKKKSNARGGERGWKDGRILGEILPTTKGEEDGGSNPPSPKNRRLLRASVCMYVLYVCIRRWVSRFGEIGH